jgi:hypothetical protein
MTRSITLACVAAIASHPRTSCSRTTRQPIHRASRRRPDDNYPDESTKGAPPTTMTPTRRTTKNREKRSETDGEM